MNNKTNKNLIVVAALAILVIASRANAYVPFVWEPQPVMYNNSYNTTMTTVIPSAYNQTVLPQIAPISINTQPQFQPQPQVQQPSYQYQQVNRTISQPINTQYIVPVTNQAPQQARVSSNTSAPRVANSMNRNVNNRSNVRYNEVQNTQLLPVISSNQSASAYGVVNPTSTNNSSNFMPNTILGWFLVILLILAMIILVRKLSRDNHYGAHIAPAN